MVSSVSCIQDGDSSRSGTGLFLWSRQLPVVMREVNEERPRHACVWPVCPTYLYKVTHIGACASPDAAIQPHWGGNRALMWLVHAYDGAVGAALPSVRKASWITVAKISKKFEIVVDSSKGSRLYTPHQRLRRRCWRRSSSLLSFAELDEIQRAA